MSSEKAMVTRVFTAAGIEINGKNPWDIQVHDERFYKRLLAHTTLGLGESYMEKWWDAERVDLFVEKLIRAPKPYRLTLPVIWLGAKALFFNLQSRVGARKVIERHYDLSNDLYKSFLDPYMVYSCGYFKNTDDLNTAQKQKLDLICKKLKLKAGERVLDIGCGWGGFAKYAAETYGCTVVGITLSAEQAAYAQSVTAGLPVEIRKQDYRDLRGEIFDKIVSVGMFEHVGYKNYRTFMKIAHAALADDGLCLLHSIGSNDTKFFAEPWIDTYIFPGGMLPSIKQIGQAIEKKFVMEDWHNFGPYYYQTLLAWDANFRASWAALRSTYDETFYRMFHYYFTAYGSAFKAREVQLWQIVLSKGKSDRVYESVR